MALRQITNNFPRAATVSWGSRPRWIVPTPHRMRNSSGVSGTVSASFDSTATRYGFTAPYATSRVKLLATVAAIGTGVGERGPLNGDWNERRQGVPFRAGIAIGTGTGTAFQFTSTGTNGRVLVGRSLEISSNLSLSVSEGDQVWIRGAWYRPTEFADNSIAWRLPLNRVIQLHDQVERNVATTGDTWITSNSSTNSNSTSGEFILFETTNPLVRCVKIKGSSSSVAGNGWGVESGQEASTHPNGFVSKSCNSAHVAAEYACFLGGMQWFGLGEAGTNIFREFQTNVSTRVTDANFEQRQNQFAVRHAIENVVGFSDEIWVGWGNEAAIMASGHNATNDLEAMVDVLRQKIERNIARNCRTWIMLGSATTTWTGGGTSWDASLTDAQFRDAQTTNHNGILNQRTFREALLARLDSLCKELGSAWVFDSCKVTHSLNAAGGLVWNRISDKAGGFVSSTSDGTHFTHLAHELVGAAFYEFFGDDLATSFPAWGVLNPGNYT